MQNGVFACDFDGDSVDIDPPVCPELYIYLSTTEIATSGAKSRTRHGYTKLIIGKVEVLLRVDPGIGVAESIFSVISVIFFNFMEFFLEVLIFMNFVGVAAGEG